MLTVPAEQDCWGTQTEHHFLRPAQAGEGDRHVPELEIPHFLLNLFLIWMYLPKLRRLETNQPD